MTSENRQPESFEFDYLTLVNYRGQELDVSTLMRNMTITQDLFTTCMHGSIQLFDAIDLQQEFPLIGEEKLKFKYRTTEEFDWVEQEFRVYSLSNRIQFGEGSFGYVLDFVSEEMIYNKFMVISESFRSKQISDIVRQVIQRTNTDKEIITEKTKNKINYIQPAISPFALINSLCQKAQSPKHKGASYVFFESVNGFHFETLEDLFTRDPIQYGYNQGVRDDEQQSNLFYNIIEHEFITQQNQIDLIRKGLFGGTAKTIDPLTRSLGQKQFDYPEEFEDFKHVEDSHSEMQLTSPEFPWDDVNKTGVFKSVLSRSGRDKGYIQSNGDNFDREWSTKEETLLKRMSQLQAVSNKIKSRFMVPGNSDLAVGSMLDVKYPSFSAFDKDEEVTDRFISGRYIALTITHAFTQETMTSIIEAGKDCYKQGHEDELREQLFR